MYRIILKAVPGDPVFDKDVTVDEVVYFESRHSRLYVEFREDRDEYGGDSAYFDMGNGRTAEVVFV
jgi:hypothetical protein